MVCADTWNHRYISANSLTEYTLDNLELYKTYLIKMKSGSPDVNRSSIWTETISGTVIQTGTLILLQPKLSELYLKSQMY